MENRTTITSDSEVLMVFIKNAVAGKVKTRLAASIGDQAALNVYQALLRHTLEISIQLQVSKMVFYSDHPQGNDAWKRHGFSQHCQEGQDLGHKMLAAFRVAAGSGYTKMIVIGSDCLELSAAILLKAFDALGDHDVVIGPAKDGGYYLLGMKEVRDAFFFNKCWSTASVFEDTMHDISSSGLSVYTLPQLADIDRVADLPASWNLADFL